MTSGLLQDLQLQLSDLRTEVATLRVEVGRLTERGREQAGGFRRVYERLDKIERAIRQMQRPPSGAFRAGDDDEVTGQHDRPTKPPREPR